MTRTYSNQEIEAMTDGQVLAALSEDFLERDGDTFVRIRRSERLGWEETLPKGSSYSQRMLNPKNEEELLKSAYAHACDMITAMNTPFKVKVCVSGDRSFTDSRMLYVASDVLDDKTMTIGQRLDAFTGYTVHEGSHLLYTDFGIRPTRNQITRFLHNVLEDEMIEIKLGEEKPGFANFIAAAKYHAFGRYEKKADAQKSNTLTDIVNAILALVRYPKQLDMEMIREHGRLLLKARQIITPFPSSTSETMVAAERIRDLILSEYEDMIRNEQQNQSRQQTGDTAEKEQGGQQAPSEPQQGEGSDNDPKGQNQTSESAGEKESEEQKESQSSSTGNLEDSEESGQEKQNGSNNGDKDETDENGQTENGLHEEAGNETDGCPSDEEIAQAAEEALNDDFDRLKEALDELTTETGKPVDRENIAEGFKKNNKVLARECEGEFTRGARSNSVIYDAPQNKQEYLNSLHRIRKYIPAVSKILRSNGTEYKTCLRGLRSGVIDPCKIAEAYQGVASIYMREGQVKADRMTVALLVDESGSMFGEKIQAARDTAVLFAEALKSVGNVKLHVYGYTRDEFELELYRYLEPGKNNIYSLGSMRERNCTPTMQAINEVSRRIAPKKDEKTLLIVISDGAPDTSIQSVATETAKAKAKGIKVMGISIDDGLPESSLKKMYGSYVKYNDMGSMVSSLAKVLKKEVLESTGKKMAV